MRFCYKCLVQYFAKNGCPVPKNNYTIIHTNNIINYNNTNNNINSDNIIGGSGSGSGDVAGATGPSILAGECPRCKHLFVLEEKPNPYEYVWKEYLQQFEKDDDNDINIPYYKLVDAKIASTQSMFWYIGRKSNGNYRPYLLTIGYCHPDLIFEELLLNDSGSKGKIEQLCQWGLLQKYKKSTITSTSSTSTSTSSTPTSRWLQCTLKNKLQTVQQWFWSKFPSWIIDACQDRPNSEGLIYHIDPVVQMELRYLLSKHLITPSIMSDSPSSNNNEEEDDAIFHLCSSGICCNEIKDQNERNQVSLIVLNYCASAGMALCQFRLVRIVRLINHALSLLLLSSKYLLPTPIDKWYINIDLNH
jgi:hypothetical protein